MKKTELNGYVYEFNVDYKNLSLSEIVKNMPVIHSYFMLKYDVK